MSMRKSSIPTHQRKLTLAGHVIILRNRLRAIGLDELPYISINLCKDHQREITCLDYAPSVLKWFDFRIHMTDVEDCLGCYLEQRV